MTKPQPSFLSPPWPNVAIEIAPRRVTAVAVARKGNRYAVTGHAVEPLAAGAVVPTLTASNLPNPAAVSEAVKRALQKIGGRPKRVGLVIPDSAAKVSFVRFDKIPERAEDLDQLVRWQIRKTAPFRIEDAQLSFTPGLTPSTGGREFVVSLVRRDIVEEYERVCSDAGAHAGVVDLSTFNLINLVLASPNDSSAPAAAGDWLLVNVTPEYTTLTIVRDGHLVFFRNLRDEGEGSLADSVHQTAMYYEDRLSGAGFDRVLLAGGSSSPDRGHHESGEAARITLEQRLNKKVTPLDVRALADLTDRITPGPDLLDALASPVGLLVREAA